MGDIDFFSWKLLLLRFSTCCFEINICMFDKICYAQFSSKHLRVRPWRSRNPQKSSKRQNEARSRGREAQRIR